MQEEAKAYFGWNIRMWNIRMWEICHPFTHLIQPRQDFLWKVKLFLPNASFIHQNTLL